MAHSKGVRRLYWEAGRIVEDEYRAGAWVRIYGPGVNYPRPLR